MITKNIFIIFISFQENPTMSKEINTQRLHHLEKRVEELLTLTTALFCKVVSIQDSIKEEFNEIVTRYPKMRILKLSDLNSECEISDQQDHEGISSNDATTRSTQDK